MLNTYAQGPAWEAAQQLIADGEHVHFVAEGEAWCVSEHCVPKQP